MQDAINRWRQAQGDLAAWIIFSSEICPAVAAIVGGAFICPFAQSSSQPPATKSECMPYVLDWEELYC